MSNSLKNCKHGGIKAIETMLREEGVIFRLLRMHNHAVYELDTPFGPRRLTVSLTTSDRRAADRQRSNIRNLMKRGIAR